MSGQEPDSASRVATGETKLNKLGGGGLTSGVEVLSLINAISFIAVTIVIAPHFGVDARCGESQFPNDRYCQKRTLAT